jgi:hypothetical protein
MGDTDGARGAGFDDQGVGGRTLGGGRQGHRGDVGGPRAPTAPTGGRLQVFNSFDLDSHGVALGVGNVSTAMGSQVPTSVSGFVCAATPCDETSCRLAEAPLSCCRCHQEVRRVCKTAFGFRLAAAGR